MIKPIQPHPLEIKAIEDGASAMLFVIDEGAVTKLCDPYDFDFENLMEQLEKNLDGEYVSHSFKQVILKVLPLQVGDKFQIEQWINEHDGMDYSGDNPKIFTRYPFYSGDSTGLDQNHSRDGWENIVNRIEPYNSPKRYGELGGLFA